MSAHQSLTDLLANRQIEAVEYVIEYVGAHPGATPQDIIGSPGRPASRKIIEQAIKDLLYGHPKRLRSEHPAGTHAFGRGTARLWLSE